MTVGERIRARLQAMNMSQAELRKALELLGLNLSRQAISGWCRGARPELAHLDLVMDVLVVPSAEREKWTAQWMAEERGRVSLSSSNEPTT